MYCIVPCFAVVEYAFPDTNTREEMERLSLARGVSYQWKNVISF